MLAHHMQDLKDVCTIIIHHHHHHHRHYHHDNHHNKRDNHDMPGYPLSPLRELPCFQTARNDARCWGKGGSDGDGVYDNDDDDDDNDDDDHHQGDPVSHPLATLEGEVNRDEERLDDLQVGFSPYHDDNNRDDDLYDHAATDNIDISQSELESNFSARICQRLERLQVAGNVSQVMVDGDGDGDG